MGFFDDLAAWLNFLNPPTNYGFGEGASQDSIESDQSTLSLDGVNPAAGQTMENLESPRTPDVPGQRALLQRKEQPFQVIDIDPFNTFSFSNIIPSLQQIFDVVGNEGENDANNGLPVSQPWRSIQIPIPGNFLRFEFLPTKVNFQDNVQANLPNPNDSNALHRIKPDESFNPDFDLLVGGTPTSFPGDNAATAQFMHRIQSRQVLIQFDETNQSPLLLSHGRTFTGAFSQIFLTFKIGCPKFRIIIGNNAQILDFPDVNRIVNSNPAFGGGQSLWENPSRHCVPFCFCFKDQNPTASGFVLQNGENLFKIFTNQNLLAQTTIESHGVVIGWITSFIASFSSSNENVAQTNSAYIKIVRHDGSTSKLLAYLPLTERAVNTSPAPYYMTGAMSYSLPIRFVLKPGDSLAVGMFWGSGSNLSVGDFGVTGYTYGRTGSQTVFGSSLNYSGEAVTTNPFPLDSLIWNS